MAGRLIVPGYMPALDSNGAPLSGAKLYTYVTGLTAPATTYADANLSVPNTNPILANSAGQFPSIFAADGSIFSIALTTALGVPVIAFDDVGLAQSAGFSNVTGSLAEGAYTATGGDTHVTVSEPVAIAGLLTFHRNGVDQKPGVDFTADGTANIVLTTPAIAGETFWWEHIGGVSVNAGTRVLRAGDTMTGTLQAYALTNTDGMPNLAQVGGEPQSNTHTRLEFNTFPSINPFQPVSIQLHSRHTASRNNSNVAFTVITDTGPGSGDAWCGNWPIYAGVGSPASINLYGMEYDSNNSSRHYGDNPFSYTARTGDFEYCHDVSVAVINAGTATYRVTAAKLIRSVGGRAYNRGVAIDGDCISQAAYCDDSNAPVSYRVSGAHLIGVDLSRATGMSTAMTIPNNAVLAWARTDAGAVNVRVDSGNALRLGEGATAAYVASQFLPAADNAYAAGASGARFSSIWAANGTIQTSDASLKTDVQDMPGGVLAFVQALRPVTFKWTSGGQVAVPIKKTVTRPKLDAAGVPVVGEPEPMLNAHGEVMLEEISAAQAKKLQMHTADEVWDVEGRSLNLSPEGQALHRDGDGRGRRHRAGRQARN